MNNYRSVFNARSSANPRSAKLRSTFYPQVRTYGPQLLVRSLPVRRSAGPHFTHALPLVVVSDDRIGVQYPNSG